MTQQNTLETNGSLNEYPLGELIVEIIQANLSGSLRLSRDAQKAVIYFKDGRVVYGVSNSKEHRLFSVLISRKKVEKGQISKYPHYANDLELGASLIAEGKLTEKDLEDAVVSQIEAILIEAMSWIEGEWLFSPLARLRSDLVYYVEVHKVLINYARCLPIQTVFERFKSVQETFLRTEADFARLHLLAHEQHVAEQFRDVPLKIADLRNMTTLPEQGLLQALYVLWLGGVLVRQDWNAAFSPLKIAQILTARLSVVKKAATIAGHDAPEPEAESADSKPPEADPEPVQPKAAALDITLDEYLKRAEVSETHYDVLGVSEKAPISEIKLAYFGLAKLFHPDRYHREGEAMLRRIQVAFTKLAHAYETLKTKESRESYDYKIRKEIEAREKRRAEGLTEVPDSTERKSEQGLESFEQGLLMLSEEEYESAATHLARAVHYSPENALYHAYYGKALSAFSSHRHKAEAELQSAVKLDGKNPKIRLMLVEFFIEMNMAKRAEGELKRFLEAVPGNKEAEALLRKLQSTV